MAHRKEIIGALLIVALLICVWLLISQVDSVHHNAENQFVRDAVRNAALTCYSVEGAYPDNLQYLRDYYGLAYDESRYKVTYDAFASNLLPDIYVVEVGRDA